MINYLRVATNGWDDPEDYISVHSLGWYDRSILEQPGEGEFFYIDTHGWFESGDYIAVDSFGWFDKSILVEKPKQDYYVNYNDMPNQFINKCMNSNYAGSVGTYNNERELFDLMVTEAYNKHGVCMDYYVTSYNKDHDRIWGEDGNRTFSRRFQIMTFYTLPREEKLWTKFGIEGMDSFSIYASKRHFWEASQFNDNGSIKSFDPYIPKVGDYLFSNYNKYIYEITEVKDEVMMNLLSKQHVWEFMVRPFKDEKISVSPLTSAAPIANYTNKPTDKLDVSNIVNQKKQTILYQPKPTEKNVNNPFTNW